MKFMEKEQAEKTIRKLVGEWYNLNKEFSGKSSLRR